MLDKLKIDWRNIWVDLENAYTVFPHIVSTETIFFLNLEIVANLNSCRNIYF